MRLRDNNGGGQKRQNRQINKKSIRKKQNVVRQHEVKTAVTGGSNEEDKLDRDKGIQHRVESKIAERSTSIFK